MPTQAIGMRAIVAVKGDAIALAVLEAIQGHEQAHASFKMLEGLRGGERWTHGTVNYRTVEMLVASSDRLDAVVDGYGHVGSAVLVYGGEEPPSAIEHRVHCADTTQVARVADQIVQTYFMGPC